MDTVNNEIQFQINPGQLSLENLRILLTNKKLRISISPSVKSNTEIELTPFEMVFIK